MLYPNRSLTLPVALAAAVTLMAPGLAQAQAFSATLLKRPSGNDGCGENMFRTQLTDSGDVVGTCNFPAVSVQGWLAALSGQGVPEYTTRATVWRGGSGTPRLLNGLAGQAGTYAVGGLADGTVLGYAYGKVPATLSAWKGTTRSNYSLPAGYSGWQLDRVSRDGQTLLIAQADTSRFGRSFALVKGGAVTRLPDLPAGCGAVNNSSGVYTWAINNSAQVVVLRDRTEEDVSIKRRYHVGTVCLWDGSAWQVSPDTPNFFDPVTFDSNGYELSLQGINDRGEVLVRQQQAAFTWHPQQGYTALDRRAWSLGAAGDVGGGTYPGSYTEAGPAVLWRNGQLLELGKVATAPIGYRFINVLGTNARGQVLAVAQSTAKTINPANNLLVLLTPR
ncbi:MAG: hypothetical protein RI907_2666 [Pseudomonadota bacterium]